MGDRVIFDSTAVKPTRYTVMTRRPYAEERFLTSTNSRRLAVFIARWVWFFDNEDTRVIDTHA